MNSRFSKIPQLVQPATDLGLSEIKKSLELKNAKIEKGYTTIASSIDNISNLDVIRGIDKDYIQSRLNSAITKLNSYGNVDLSDMRNTYELNTVVEDISKDPIIKKALLSTKYIQNIQKQREQINTNPKLQQYVNYVNESTERDEINEYLKSQDINKSFDRKNAIIGMDTHKFFTDVAKNVKAKTHEEKRKGDPFNNWIVTEKTPEMIESSVVSSIQTNPELMSQLQRNFNYLYKNKDSFVTAIANEQKVRSAKIDRDLVALDTRIAAAKLQGLDVTELEGYKKNRIELKKDIKTALDISKLPDEELRANAFKAYVSNLAQDYGQAYTQYDEKSKTDMGALALAKLEFEGQKFKYDQTKDYADRTFDENKFNAEYKLKERELDIKTLDVLGKISPSAAAEFKSTGKLPSPSNGTNFEENPYIYDSNTIPKDFDPEDHHKKTMSNLKETNLALASGIVEKLTMQGSYFKEKVDEYVKKGLIKTVEKDGKLIKDKYYISNAGLQAVSTFIESVEKTQGTVLSNSNAQIKQALDEIEKNNIKYSFYDFNRNKFLKSNGLTDKELNESGGILSMTGIPTEFNVKKDNFKKDMQNFYQSAFFNTKVPVANINKSYDSAKVSNENLRADVKSQLRDGGIYSSTNPTKIYSIDNLQNGKTVVDDDIVEDLKDVDWENSFSHVIPQTNEIEFTLVNKKGEPVISDAFPNGVARTKLSDPLITKALKTTNPSLEKSQFRPDDKLFDIMKQTTDTYANEFLKGKTFHIPGIESKYNLRMEVSKHGDKFYLSIPSMSSLKFNTESVDDFTKRFSQSFNELMERARGLAETRPELNTEQKRVNETLKALEKLYR